MQGCAAVPDLWFPGRDGTAVAPQRRVADKSAQGEETPRQLGPCRATGPCGQWRGAGMGHNILRSGGLYWKNLIIIIIPKIIMRIVATTTK